MGAIRGALAGVGAVVAAIALSGCVGGPSGTVDPVGTWGDPSAAESPYLALASDGSLTGSDGCNRLTGSWRVDQSDHVDFEDVASTRMACEGVDTWLSALDEATISGDTMTVIDDDGSEIGTLDRTSDQPETASPAPTTSATPGATDDSPPTGADLYVGTWGTNEAQQPHLVINADGTVTGSDGCNQLTGRWEVDDDDGTLDFEDMASTLMACEGVDQSLTGLEWASVAGDTMTVLDDQGIVLASLPRTA